MATIAPGDVEGAAPSVRENGKGADGGGLSVAILMRSATGGKNALQGKLTARLAAADSDGDGRLDHKEVLRVMQELVEEEVSKTKWRKAALWGGAGALLMMMCLVATVVGLTAVVIEKTKDTKVEGNMLVQKTTIGSSKPLATASVSTSYIGASLDLSGPIQALAHTDKWIIAINSRQIVMDIKALVRTPRVVNETTGEVLAHSFTTLYTSLGEVMLPEDYNPLELAHALKDAGVNLGELAPLPVRHRRRLQQLPSQWESCEATRGQCPAGYSAQGAPPNALTPPGTTGNTFCVQYNGPACSVCACRSDASCAFVNVCSSSSVTSSDIALSLPPAGTLDMLATGINPALMDPNGGGMLVKTDSAHTGYAGDAATGADKNRCYCPLPNYCCDACWPGKQGQAACPYRTIFP